MFKKTCWKKREIVTEARCGCTCRDKEFLIHFPQSINIQDPAGLVHLLRHYCLDAISSVSSVYFRFDFVQANYFPFVTDCILEIGFCLLYLLQIRLCSSFFNLLKELNVVLNKQHSQICQQYSQLSVQPLLTKTLDSQRQLHKHIMP